MVPREPWVASGITETCTFLCTRLRVGTHTPGPDKHTHHTTTFVMSRPWKQGWPSGEQQVHGLVVSIPQCLDVTRYALGVVEPAFSELSPGWGSLSRGSPRGLGTQFLFPGLGLPGVPTSQPPRQGSMFQVGAQASRPSAAMLL